MEDRPDIKLRIRVDTASNFMGTSAPDRLRTLIFWYSTIFFFNSMNAIAVFSGPRVKGTVQFRESPEWTTVHLDLTGLKKNARHGFHIHEFGNLSKGCESMGAHFNPFGQRHGGPKSSARHVGDLGNIITDSEGRARYTFRDRGIRLHGRRDIVGRGLVIHADPDDLGLGGHELSHTTGNSGKRIAGAIIGRSA